MCLYRNTKTSLLVDKKGKLKVEMQPKGGLIVKDADARLWYLKEAAREQWDYLAPLPEGICATSVQVTRLEIDRII